MMKIVAVMALFALSLFSETAIGKEGADEIVGNFDVNRMRADLKFLSNDLLEGRGTGARGGQVAAEYIATQFQLAGLKPLGDNGTYLQKVPLTGVNTQPESALVLQAGGQDMKLKYLDDFVGNAYSLKEKEVLNADMVFVGYGVVAPEFGWNDYEGVDVHGKVVLALVNDPPSADPAFFGGKAMTYYGRWTYKYEEAERQGAAGMLLIHNTEMASYGWGVVKNSWSGEQAFLQTPKGQYSLPLAGWITEDVARKAMQACGEDLPSLIARAGKAGFKPFALPLHITGELVAKVRALEAYNVVALLEGSTKKDEAIVYTAHYDHLGIGIPVNGDSIYNGAEDNASGTALLLELARAFAESKSRPARSVVFLSVTGEERGLKGSEYYGKNPKLPAGKTMLDLNYDGLALWGETADVTLTGAERTSVWPIVKDVSNQLGYRIEPETHPEAGYYYRSDHFSFARVGVPAFSIDAGTEYVGKPKEFGETKYKEYIEKHYHQPSDEYDPNWDLTGARKLAALGIYVGWRVAALDEVTGWKAGDEFEQVRKSSLTSNKAASH